MKVLDSIFIQKNSNISSNKAQLSKRLAATIRKIKLLISFTLLIASLFLLSNCGDSEEELSCETNSMIDRTGQGNQCGNAKVVRYSATNTTELLIIQFDMPTYNCRISINPTEGLIEETTYKLLDGASFSQTDLVRSLSLNVFVNKMDRIEHLISGSFEFTGKSGPNESDISYNGNFTDLVFK